MKTVGFKLFLLEIDLWDSLAAVGITINDWLWHFFRVRRGLLCHAEYLASTNVGL